LNGFIETSLLHIDNRWEFEDSTTLMTAWNIRKEGVTEAFQISGIPVPPGQYDWNEGNFWFIYNRAAPVNAALRVIVGGFFGGDLLTVRPSLNIRRGETFNLSLTWTRNNITLPQGHVVTNLAGARIAYNFSPRLFAQSLMQYNDSADLWSVNFRFGWLQDANTGLFVVYNETDGLGDFLPSSSGRTLTLKYSYMFDLLN